ncbi:MAG: hypothetical protein K0R71_1211 [Bacillales bacterium]|jgi:surface polysaccharide O-acyltransferase-like enzyme|nr:hypothetical protein [Bacillales bacterium]
MLIPIGPILAIPIFILICKGFKKEIDLQKEKKKFYKQLINSIIFVALLLPLAYFLGVMSTSASTEETVTRDYYKGFFFVEGFPLLVLILTLIKGRSIFLRKK